MEVTIQMDSEKYENFIDCLSVLKDICNDVDIREGIVRQRTNENTSVFQLDLTSLIPDVTISISDLKQKFDLLKIFLGQNVEVNVNDEHFSFSDEFTTIRFGVPNLDFLDNKFISENELDNIFQIDETNLILETELTKLITDRLKVITQSFNANAVQIMFNSDTSDLTVKTQAKDQFAKVLTGILLNESISNASSSLVIAPFVIQHDTDIEFKMYNSGQQNILFNTFKTTLGDVDINMFSRSSVIEEDENASI